MITLVLILLALVYVIGGMSVLLQVAWWGGALLAVAVAVRLLSDLHHTRARTTDQMESLGAIPELLRRRRERRLRTDWADLD